MVEQMPSNASRTQMQAQAVALLLFDMVLSHRLPNKARRMLEVAAAYHAAAAQAGDTRNDRVARDMVLSAPLPDLKPEHQAIIASIVALQREKVRPRRESSFLWLDHKDQQIALALAAALRLAVASDAAPGELLVRADEAGTTLIARGERADRIAAAADSGAELWRAEVGELALQATEPGDQPGASGLDVLEPAVSTNGRLDLIVQPRALDLGGEPIAEAARRLLRRFFDKLLAREDAVLKDEDSEDVHQMRVATRRLRAALQILTSVFEPKLIRRYRKGLRRIAGALGAVRDGDVFLEHIETYRAGLPEHERAQIERLISAVAY
jgi:CHAD domain-containing protein